MATTDDKLNELFDAESCNGHTTDSADVIITGETDNGDTLKVDVPGALSDDFKNAMSPAKTDRIWNSDLNCWTVKKDAEEHMKGRVRACDMTVGYSAQIKAERAGDAYAEGDETDTALNAIWPSDGIIFHEPDAATPDEILGVAREIVDGDVYHSEHLQGGYQLATYQMPVDELVEELKTELVVDDQR